MYQRLLLDVTFYDALHKLDLEIAAEWRERGCVCGGRLHRSAYWRKPRPPPGSSWPGWAERESFCCGSEGCRRRSTPPSVRFLGRRVYFGAVVVLVSSFLAGGTRSLQKLSDDFGPSRRTLLRWRRWWSRTFVSSATYRRLRGRLLPPPDPDELPRSLLAAVTGNDEQRLLAVLDALRPLSTTAVR